ncbi:MAG: 2-dehydro-3-deoxygalactonokinase [Nitrospinae bacterium]|nr:2-dehydro-3-deoxygalactonokinase [Nitrospinota bacterium]
MEIFVDWGSTNFRAFLMQEGKVIARWQVLDSGTLKAFASGAPETRYIDYSLFFTENLGAWLEAHREAPVYICGAAGSREGWVETTYSKAPAGIDDIRKNLHKLSSSDAIILTHHP